MIHAAELIRRKRDGEALTAVDLKELVLAYARGEVPDYQMSAFCMAGYFRGFSSSETFALTQALIESGTTLNLREHIGRTVVDKHSTGGVGDKTSLAVAPIVAACGVPFAKMSGRGLGYTGGTLDKLESIPGFRVELSAAEFVAQVHDVGVAIIGQTADIVPADRLLYGLRDVTATVDSIPLIASSIMSKKIAAGADAIVLDVKVGGGAFMKTLEDARSLAESMLELGRHAGRRVIALLTDMDQPLGQAVGNGLEIRETLATLRGDGPPDFSELVFVACGHLLALSDLHADEAEGRERAAAAVQDGSALAAYERWIAAQGGDPDERVLPEAAVLRDVTASSDGYVRELAAFAVGTASLRLGAGRRTKEDSIDHSVGIRCLKKRGDPVRSGEVLAQIHARTETDAENAGVEVLAAYTIGDDAPSRHSIVLETIA